MYRYKLTVAREIRKAYSFGKGDFDKSRTYSALSSTPPKL